jgi:hypothetical protein
MTPGESIVREGSDIGIVDIGECLFTAWLLTLFRPRMAEELTNRMSEDHILLNQLCRFRATRLHRPRQPALSIGRDVQPRDAASRSAGQEWTMSTDNESHLLPPADSSWFVWRDFVLRGAGFPTNEMRRLSAPNLAVAASEPSADFDAEWAAEIERLTDSLREVAADPRFRESVAWQNPSAVLNGVDKVGRPAEPGKPTAWKHIQLVANYLQRYTVKNDTIGFFGPSSWGRLTEDDHAVDCDYGPGLSAAHISLEEDRNRGTRSASR